MAKNKKPVINVSAQNISYIEKERLIKIIFFNPNSMEVEVSITEKGEEKKIMKLPLGHLPKDIKKLIRPV